MDRRSRFEQRPDSLGLWELIEERALRSPDAVLAVDEQGRRLSFGDYRRQCLRSAAALHHAGIGPGTPVAWLLPTRLEALVAAGALSRLGALQVPVVPIVGPAELGFILAQSEARMLITCGKWRGRDYPALARSVLDAGGLSTRLVVADPGLPSAEPDGLPQPPLPPGAAGDPVRWVFYTSGTTAEPKGTLHTDLTVAACAHRLNVRFDMTPEDCYSLVFPVTHIGGISCLMSGLMAGFRHVLIETFEPAAACAALAREGVTVAGAGPSFWMAYVDQQRRRPDGRLFPRLRALVGGGAPKPGTLHEQVAQTLGVPLVTGYGLSECPALAHSGVHDSEAVLRSDGYALADTEIKIAAADGRALPPGEVGEILVRGPMLFKGYLDGALDVAAFDAEGFHRTGDLGRLDTDGLLWVTGRIKDIIIRKGENISAKEVEDVLHRHPALADVAVIGLPDQTTGERCCAVVVIRPGATLPTLAEIAEHCRLAGLGSRKIPEQVVQVAALPRNPTGKVTKAALRSQLLAASS